MARPLTPAAAALAFCAFFAPAAAHAAGGDDALKKGNELVQAGRLDQALEVYRKASDSHPRNARLQMALGLALANKGDAVEAVRHLRASTQIEPSFQAWYSLGLVYANQNAFEQAVSAYQEALKINPRSYKAWYQLGVVRAGQGRFDAALEAYGKSVEMNPQFEEAYLGLGSAFFWSGDRESAHRQVERMKLLKMKEKAAALEAWLQKKEASPAPPPAPEPEQAPSV